MRDVEELVSIETILAEQEQDPNNLLVVKAKALGDQQRFTIPSLSGKRLLPALGDEQQRAAPITLRLGGGKPRQASANANSPRAKEDTHVAIPLTMEQKDAILKVLGEEEQQFKEHLFYGKAERIELSEAAQREGKNNVLYHMISQLPADRVAELLRQHNLITREQLDQVRTTLAATKQSHPSQSFQALGLLFEILNISDEAKTELIAALVKGEVLRSSSSSSPSTTTKEQDEGIAFLSDISTLLAGMSEMSLLSLNGTQLEQVALSPLRQYELARTIASIALSSQQRAAATALIGSLNLHRLAQRQITITLEKKGFELVTPSLEVTPKAMERIMKRLEKSSKEQEYEYEKRERFLDSVTNDPHQLFFETGDGLYHPLSKIVSEEDLEDDGLLGYTFSPVSVLTRQQQAALNRTIQDLLEEHIMKKQVEEEEVKKKIALESITKPKMGWSSPRSPRVSPRTIITVTGAGAGAGGATPNEQDQPSPAQGLPSKRNSLQTLTAASADQATEAATPLPLISGRVSQTILSVAKNSEILLGPTLPCH
jgi:hypothetical protein